MMNVAKIVPTITHRLGVAKNSKVESLIIQSLDGKSKICINDDVFERCQKSRQKDGPKTLFELFERLLSPKKGDSEKIMEKLSEKSSYKVSVKLLEKGKSDLQKVDASIVCDKSGYTYVGASSSQMSKEGVLKRIDSIVADGYKDGDLFSSQNHIRGKEPALYKDIIKSSSGNWVAQSVSNPCKKA